MWCIGERAVEVQRPHFLDSEKLPQPYRHPCPHGCCPHVRLCRVTGSSLVPGCCFVLVMCCYLWVLVKFLLHLQLHSPWLFCVSCRSATQGMATPAVFPGVTLPTTVTPAPLAAPAGLPATASGAPPAPFPSSCTAGSGSPLFQPASFQQQGSPMKAPEISLANVHVPLESIKPSKYFRLFTLL